MPRRENQLEGGVEGGVEEEDGLRIYLSMMTMVTILKLLLMMTTKV